eukprot:4878656-Lingulodinium_polyedra.AAC.1
MLVLSGSRLANTCAPDWDACAARFASMQGFCQSSCSLSFCSCSGASFGQQGMPDKRAAHLWTHALVF